MEKLDLGGKVVSLGVLVWMSASVGPWWIGLVLFLVGWIVNLGMKLVKAEKEGAT